MLMQALPFPDVLEHVSSIGVLHGNGQVLLSQEDLLELQGAKASIPLFLRSL